ncbi:MAG: gliding motility-associated ABC transporter ATP-binding subunit GldA [Bacteroidia bacterium]|nr:gliding motility-associated ABC transporter ATP-binding subunit GldA [Bacteroidia bacterium]MBP9689881.1 gliding motility-associated ABC transporter ATP-binding subunit GldA [Bacteroidia bacterium]
MSIQVEQLTKIYGTQRALDGISFEAKQGEILGFLGPNGAGKSTTMKILTGYLPQTSGIAKVCGFDVATQAIEVKKQIGYLPELNPLYTDMYVKEYLQFSAEVQGLKNNANKIVDEMIERVGLTIERKKKIGQLSKGYKQRVGLAQAMLHNPKVLILDEPTSGLDPNQVVEIRELIKQIGKDKTVLLSTHIMQEVESMCTRVIIINKGKIVADDKISALQQQSKNELTIVVEFKNDISESVLKNIEGVKMVKQKGKRYFLKCTTDVREQISNISSTQNWILLSMSLKEETLEAVFQKLTTK